VVVGGRLITPLRAICSVAVKIEASLAVLLFAVLVLSLPSAHADAIPQPSRSSRPDSSESGSPSFDIVENELRSPAEGPQRLIAILVEFPDRPHTISIDSIRQILTEMDHFYMSESYGLVGIVWTVTDKWYEVQTPLSRLSIQKWSYNEEDMDRFQREAVKAADKDIDFREYEYVYIVAAGGVWAHAECRFDATTSDGVSSFRGAVVNEEDDMPVYAHEMAHLLRSSYAPFNGCGLPDLYSYEAAEKGEDESVWVGPWDLMDSGSTFSAWSRITLGWLTPKMVRLTSTTATVVELQPLERDVGQRALVVPLTGKTSYVIEVRRRIGYDEALPAEGVLIYLADLGKENGHGVLRVIDGRPATKALGDAPFDSNGTFQDSKFGVYVLVAYTEGEGYVVVVSGSKIESLKDSDQDGLLDPIELQLGTDPGNPDTDGDFLKDGEEISRYRTNPLQADTDADGLPDGREIELSTDPLNVDTDDDGLDDGREVQLGTSPRAADTDGDGLNDGKEADIATNPLKADTDDDGLSDQRELSLGTNPLVPDTDGDELTDGEELQHGSSPLHPDTDNDALTDGKEIQLGTNPTIADTDQDYWRDSVDPMPTNLLIPNLILIAVLVAVVVVVVIVLQRRRRSVTHVADQFAFCMNCGTPLTRDAAFCIMCGSEAQFRRKLSS